MIRKKQIDGVVIANMKSVAKDIPDAFYKIGQIIDAWLWKKWRKRRGCDLCTKGQERLIIRDSSGILKELKCIQWVLQNFRN